RQSNGKDFANAKSLNARSTPARLAFLAGACLQLLSPPPTTSYHSEQASVALWRLNGEARRVDASPFPPTPTL
ncbi:MAG: hypothetical protein KDA61_08525, partial [Planctomycetales bacterium]|nr:hypothetical protein [Planctomycetales bacterium]